MSKEVVQYFSIHLLIPLESVMSLVSVEIMSQLGDLLFTEYFFPSSFI